MFEFLYETIGGGTYWFTSALFVAELILFCLLLLKGSSIWFYVSVCIILAYLGQNDEITSKLTVNGKYFWHWASGLVCLFFMAIGGIYWRYENIIEKQVRNKFTFVLLIIIWIVILNIPGAHLKFAAFNRALNIQGAIAGTLGSFIIICICKKTPYSKVLDFIGANSIAFYFLSGAIPTIYSMLFLKICGEPNIVGLLFVFILSIITAYFITKLLKRYFKFLFDVRCLWK